MANRYFHEVKKKSSCRSTATALSLTSTEGLGHQVTKFHTLALRPSTEEPLLSSVDKTLHSVPERKLSSKPERHRDRENLLVLATKRCGRRGYVCWKQLMISL